MNYNCETTLSRTKMLFIKQKNTKALDNFLISAMTKKTPRICSNTDHERFKFPANITKQKN